MPDARKPVTFRVTPETGRLLDLMSRRLGISKAAVFALAIREMAERRGIEVRNEAEGKVAA